jgi:proton-translocating NADH-quinone oxidoreductase chain N
MISLVIQPLLTLLVAVLVVPLIGIVSRRAVEKKIRELVVIAAFALAIFFIYQLYNEVSIGGPQEFLFGDLSSALGGIQLYVDKLSIYMAFIFCGLGLLTSIYSLKYMELDTGLDEYYILLLTLVAGMVGVAFSGDFFNLYVFWELMCISSYSLVSFRKETWEPVEAGFKYLIMSTIGALLVLFSISLIYATMGTVNFRDIAAILSGSMLTPDSIILILSGAGGVNVVSISMTTMYFIIGMIIIGFGVTASIVPLHSWLPDAHPAAPSSISAMLSGAVIKVGAYAMMRSLFTIFSPLVFDYGTVLVIFGLVTVTVSNIMALVQSDIKRLLAYSSIVNIGFIMTGFGFGAYVLFHYPTVYGLSVATLAIMGALFHVLNHAIGKGLLFLGSGNFVHALDTREIAGLEGIGRKMLWTGMPFLIGLLALAGIPPLNGFWSKLFIIFAGFGVPSDLFMNVAAVILVLNSVFAASYYLWLAQRIIFKKMKNNDAEIHQTPAAMLAPVIVLALLCIIIGLLPGNAINLAEDAAKALLGV